MFSKLHISIRKTYRTVKLDFEVCSHTDTQSIIKQYVPPEDIPEQGHYGLHHQKKSNVED